MAFISAFEVVGSYVGGSHFHGNQTIRTDKQFIFTLLDKFKHIPIIIIVRLLT